MRQFCRFLALAALLFVAEKTTAQCPAFVACPTKTDTFCDLTPNDPLFWNQPGFATPLTGISDLFETSAELSIQVKTTCGNVSDIGLRYLLWLDLDADGTQETVLDSDNLPPAGQVLKGNATNPNFAGGTPLSFDTRPVSDVQKMRFSLEKTTSGDTLRARLRWNTGAAPADFSGTQLPAGQHRMVWLLQKPGGSTDTCSRTFRVLDCKAPTVTCIPNLSVNILPTGMIQLWASDFLQYTEDNATPTNQLEIAVRRKGTGTGFPLNTSGEPERLAIFACADLGTHEVELWSRDKSGNASFCETYVIVQDNALPCGGPTVLNVCIREHCNNLPFSDSEITVQITRLGMPFWTKTLISDNNGCFQLKSLGAPLSSDMVITPTNDQNPLNGLSTYDLVLISKHILGLEPLNSPYKMIAADANRSGSITTFDIVEIRKLILGIYTELPNNTSWRFVDRHFAFSDHQNPFKTAFPENITLGNINNGLLPEPEFVAMKIGDVNCSATVNTFSAETTDRAALPLLAPDRWLAAGEILDLPLWTEAAGDWQGCQMSFGYDPQVLDIENVESNVLPGFDAQHWAKPQPGTVNLSWSGASPARAGGPMFTLRLRASAPLRLRDALWLQNERLRPECYDSEATPQPLRLEFRKQAPPQAEQTDISAPQPNPTSGSAAFRVQLTEAAPVQVQVFDLSGREVFHQEIAGAAGAVWAEIPASAFPQTGVYLWRVSAGSQVRAGKLVRQ